MTYRFGEIIERKKEKKRELSFLFESADVTNDQMNVFQFTVSDILSIHKHTQMHALLFAIIAKLNVSLSSVISPRRSSAFDVNNRGEK